VPWQALRQLARRCVAAVPQRSGYAPAQAATVPGQEFKDVLRAGQGWQPVDERLAPHAIDVHTIEPG
jgi:hypothetical protein